MAGIRTCTLAALTAAVVLAAPAAAQADAQCPWMDKTQAPKQRAAQLLAAMSMDDKIAMLHGAEPSVWGYYGMAGHVAANPRLCIPDLVLNDAGNGVGDHQVNTTAFPVALAQAASWDRNLETRFGRALGWEAWHKGVNVQLAPGVNIARVPMNGRNFEYMGEDPFLSGQTAAAEIRGIQTNPVIATVKHYALNNQETDRMTATSEVDERTLHEIYLPAFEAAVKQGKVGAVMCSYNRIGGIYACEQPDMLNGVLKRQLGFDGWVMSDWGGQHSTVEAANAGLDMEMGIQNGVYFADQLKSAVQAGKVPESRLDDMVRRIVTPMFRIGLFEQPAAAEPAAYNADTSTPDEIALARKVAEQGTVLLKNQDGILPLTGTGKTIALIGEAAGQAGAEQSYGGGGSSHVPEVGNSPEVVSPQTAIQQAAQAHGDRVIYTDGTATADAIAAAKLADVAIVFARDSESEGVDRKDLTLVGGGCALFGCVPETYDQNALIAAVADANPNTAVVLNTGGPVTMPWLDKVKGVLEAWYPGQEHGNAIASILYGLVNPSGKLPQTFPASEKDLPTAGSPEQYPGKPDDKGIPRVVYSEGLQVGYRWYDAKGIAPLFPFGYGLSYTTFAYSKLRVVRTKTGATVRFVLANTGARSGAEVTQVYVAFPAKAGEPPRQLKGFRKVPLEPGQSKFVSIKLDRRAFQHWDVARDRWVTSRGSYRIMVGGSSRDLPLNAKFSVLRPRARAGS